LRNSAISFAEGVFDRIEIRAVGCKIKMTRARGVDRFAQAFDLVRSKILLDDDIPQQEFENLLEIGAASICRDAPAPQRARAFFKLQAAALNKGPVR
jgi:hypothetical protein